ncbi:MAG: hypothetical protein V1861_05135 [Candidatus Micrarchaeota archaeon]
MPNRSKLQAAIGLRLICLVVLSIAGCMQTRGGGNEPPRNLTSEDLAPFIQAGCQNGSDDYLDCANASFRSQFHCFSTSLQVMGDGLSLEPSMVLVACPVEVYGNNLTEAQMEGFFYCSGGMLRTCTSYVAWDGSKFVQIRNPDALARFAAPISSEGEALAFIILSKDVIRTVERGPLPSLAAKAQKNESGFLVTAYSHNTFGCYDKVDYEEVRFQVSPEGKIEELGRKVVYTRNLGYAVCVD